MYIYRNVHISVPGNQSKVSETLDCWNVSYMNIDTGEPFVIWAGPVYFSGIIILIGIVVLWMLPFIAAGVKEAFWLCLCSVIIFGPLVYISSSKKIYDGNNYIERKGVGKPYVRISFSEIQRVDKIETKPVYSYCIYSDGIERLKISSAYENSSQFEAIAKNRGWF